MRKLALGISAAALLTAAAAAPAVAQVGFYAGPFGVGVGVGAPAYYDCGYYGNPCGYYDYYGGPTWWLAAAGVVGAAVVGMTVTPTSITARYNLAWLTATGLAR